jgi:nucleoside-diphosphate-sugar epimerase
MTAASDAPIAIIGATSRLAADFVRSAAPLGLTFALFARRPQATAAFLRDNDLPERWNCGSLDDAQHLFASREAAFGGVLNFVGVGDPARAHAMGADIFSATWRSDQLALRLIERSPGIPYVFMSSGAVYGTDYSAPATVATPSQVPVNDLKAQDFYTVAKLHAEAVHRSCTGATIIDVRIFNYVSRYLDSNARFLITDLVRAARDGTMFETADVPFHRDFLGPAGVRDLLLACLRAPSGTNRPVDAYSRAPISKRELLALMAEEFGLRYSFTGGSFGVNATGAKPFYYSDNRAAAELGYAPTQSSADAIREEVGAMLRNAPAAQAHGYARR